MSLSQDLIRMFLGSDVSEDSAHTAGGGETPTAVSRQQKKPKGTPVTRLLISLVITLIFGFVYFYFKLPALNIHSGSLYWFIFWLCLVFSVCLIVLRGYRADRGVNYIPYARKHLAIPFYIVLIMLAVAVVGTIVGWAALRPYAYASLLKTETGDFSQEVSEVSWDQIPMLDEASANNLTNRKLGELSDLVSQFTVSSLSAQINYKGAPVRVTYLNYGNIFKWLNNRSDGIPAYMIINMVTQEVGVTRLDEGIKYSPSEYFGRDLSRYLRFKYPTLIFGDTNFEIDDNGTPYWVASVIDKTIGLFGGEDVSGAVLLNAVTGEATHYDIKDVPTWVDRVYPAALIIRQYDYYGRYQGGFWNSLFGQSGCTETTDGYNYIAMDDDVWLYTGITSVSEDRGNIGFILVNQRTKEASYYSCAGAEEFSAMSSAQGAVQQYSYISTFPLLLNISGNPTYFMALKDTGGLVKMYAMVNVQQYQIVATGTSVQVCQENYRNLLVTSGIISEEPQDNAEGEPAEDTLLYITGEITEIRSAVMDGNTRYYLLLKGGDAFYSLSAVDNPITVILNPGDVVTIGYASGDGEIVAASSVEKQAAPGS